MMCITVPRDLTGSVDVMADAQCATESAQILHRRSIVFPDKGVMRVAARNIRIYDDLPGGIDVGAVAVITAEGTQVKHRRTIVLPQKGVLIVEPGARVGTARELPKVVDGSSSDSRSESAAPQTVIDPRHRAALAR